MTHLIEKHWLSFRKMSNVKSFLALKMQGFCKAICKSRHWNLGIGIETGIGTDITNAIISSSMRPMEPKLSRMIT